MGIQKEGLLTTEEFAYQAAVIIHQLLETKGQNWLDEVFKSRGFSTEERDTMIDEAYRRRLE